MEQDGTGNRSSQDGTGNRLTQDCTGNRLTGEFTELRTNSLLLFLTRKMIIAVRVLCWDNVFYCVSQILLFFEKLKQMLGLDLRPLEKKSEIMIFLFK